MCAWLTDKHNGYNGRLNKILMVFWLYSQSEWDCYTYPSYRFLYSPVLQTDLSRPNLLYTNVENSLYYTLVAMTKPLLWKTMYMPLAKVLYSCSWPAQLPTRRYRPAMGCRLPMSADTCSCLTSLSLNGWSYLLSYLPPLSFTRRYGFLTITSCLYHWHASQWWSRQGSSIALQAGMTITGCIHVHGACRAHYHHTLALKIKITVWWQHSTVHLSVNYHRQCHYMFYVHASETKYGRDLKVCLYTACGFLYELCVLYIKPNTVTTRTS